MNATKGISKHLVLTDVVQLIIIMKPLTRIPLKCRKEEEHERHWRRPVLFNVDHRLFF